jgi:seryl-tRNA(Sec) selenium transferase
LRCGPLHDHQTDLVVISGEKGLEGPESTEILAGPKDLIEAASLNHSHNTTSKSARIPFANS